MKAFLATLACSALLFSSITSEAEAARRGRQLRGKRSRKGKGSGDSSQLSTSSSHSDSSSPCEAFCPDPVGVVLDLFHCVVTEDGACAAAAYDPGFERYHNEVFSGNISGVYVFRVCLCFVHFG